jgi:hypothetical protein
MSVQSGEGRGRGVMTSWDKYQQNMNTIWTNSEGLRQHKTNVYNELRLAYKINREKVIKLVVEFQKLSTILKIPNGQDVNYVDIINTEFNKLDTKFHESIHSKKKFPQSDERELQNLVTLVYSIRNLVKDMRNQSADPLALVPSRDIAGASTGNTMRTCHPPQMTSNPIYEVSEKYQSLCQNTARRYLGIVGELEKEKNTNIQLSQKVEMLSEKIEQNIFTDERGRLRTREEREQFDQDLDKIFDAAEAGGGDVEAMCDAFNSLW